MRLKLISYITLTTGLALSTVSCNEEFLNQPPPGTYSDVSLQNKKGVEGMLIAAYAALDGSYFESWDNNFFNQNAGASNWIWGGVQSEEAYKGTEESDGVDITPIERYEAQPGNNYYWDKWRGCYDGIGKANQALRGLAIIEAKGLVSAEEATRIRGEARFLRGHYHFEALKVFGVPPYVDETADNSDKLFAIQNDHVIWPEIEADFQYAYDNLPEQQIAEGRANKWAAAAYLGKTYVYQGKWAQALPILTAVIDQGKTSAGLKYKLMDQYADNFVVTKERGSTESIFAFEASANDGTIGNGNYENTLNQPHGSSAKYAGCCGFYQPSQNLVNSFKTSSGLPMPDTFNDSDLLSDEGKTSLDPFTPDGTTPLDPRLDWTVGRRGIPYLDWGLHPGNNWIRKVSHGGPYSPKKNVPYLVDRGTAAASYDWGFTATAQNVHIIRFADVLLLAAEAEAEAGDLGKALTYVNLVRNRAKNSPVYTYKNNADPSSGFTTTPAANYQIEPYGSFADAAAALKAIRFERKLELGMEGHRFFDLVRWDNNSEGGKTKLTFDIKAYIDAYIAGETGNDETHPRGHLSGVSFTEKYKYAPIPENAVTLMTQNGVKLLDQSKAWGGSRDLP